MPNIKSAIKRTKTSAKKTLNNSKILSRTKTAIKKYNVANENKEKDSEALLNKAKAEIDHACSKGVIKKNAANRKKSRLEKKLNAKKTTSKKTTKKEEK